MNPIQDDIKVKETIDDVLYAELREIDSQRRTPRLRSILTFPDSNASYQGRAARLFLQTQTP